MKNLILLLLGILILSGCSVRRTYHPAKKYAPAELQQDYRLFRSMLEKWHPSLYWYTPKDSMDHFFRIGESKLQDSLTEPKFRLVLSYVISKINCGHTSVRASKGAVRYTDTTLGSRNFPLGLKIWKDTAIVTANANRRDTAVTRGVLLRSIDGKPVSYLIDTFFSHLTRDGYNDVHRYQSLSNRGLFAAYYAAIFGWKRSFPVEYMDTAGNIKTARLSLFRPVMDTSRRPRPAPTPPSPSKKQMRERMLLATRNLRFDSLQQTAYMDLNSFAKGYQIGRFFRRSFRKLHKSGTPNLVIDLRGNGGGYVSHSNLLTRYISDKPFKIADSLYAIRSRGKEGRYMSEYLSNRFFFLFMTRKDRQGRYHFRYFENRYFKPKKRNHYNRTVYILTGGNTFSAATLFTQAVMDQPNVVVVGEETGGAAYGNTAWLMPEVTLPVTGVRFRLPLFRLVINKNLPHNGRGIVPEVLSEPTVEDIRRNTDFKMEKVEELIRLRGAGIK